MMETTGSGEWVGDWPDEGKMAAVSLLDESVEVAPEAVAVADASATATTDASATATTDASVVLTTDEPTTTSAPQLASGGSVAAPTSTDVSVEVAPGGSSASAETEADAPPAVGSTAWVRPDAEAQAACEAAGIKYNAARKKRAGTSAKVLEVLEGGQQCKLQWVEVVGGRTDTTVLKMPTGAVTSSPPPPTGGSTPTKAAHDETSAAPAQAPAGSTAASGGSWTAADDARLASLVEGSAVMGERGLERWKHIAAQLGGGRTAAQVRQRWAERDARAGAQGAPSRPGGELWPGGPTPVKLPPRAATAVAAESVAPPGWSPDDCRQLARLVRQFEGSRDQSRPPTGSPARGDRWGAIAAGMSPSAHLATIGSTVSRFTARDCRSCWLEFLQPAREEGVAAAVDCPPRPLEIVCSGTVTDTREVAGAGWTDRGYTLYRLDAKTSIGRVGVEGQSLTERRYSEFELFHRTVVEPLQRTGRCPLAELPPKSTMVTEAVVQARMAALDRYVGAVVDLARRLNSADVHRMLLEFLGAGAPPAFLSELPSRLWDPTGTWKWALSVDFQGTQCTVPHVLELAADGLCRFKASGHPAAGGAVTALGSWRLVADASRLALTFHRLDVTATRASLDGATDELVLSGRRKRPAATGGAGAPGRPPPPGHGWYRVDDGGAVAYRRSRLLSDASGWVAPPGTLVRAVKIEREWLQADSGLWLPKQYLFCVDGASGLPIPLTAVYKLTLGDGDSVVGGLGLLGAAAATPRLVLDSFAGAGEHAALSRHYRLPAEFR